MILSLVMDESVHALTAGGVDTGCGRVCGVVGGSVSFWALRCVINLFCGMH